MKSNRWPCHGYSLIELLLVMAIVGILALAGVYYSQSPVPAAVKATASSLNGALRSAQTLALGSGQQVYLRTTGGGAAPPQLEWGFRILNANGTLASLGPVQGAWTIPPADARYVSIGVGDADLTASGVVPLPGDVAAISSHVLDNATIWAREFFTGSTAPDPCPFFMGNGAINQEFAVTVSGARSGAVFRSGNRMELIIVSSRSGISAYKVSPLPAGSVWNRN
ncbi:MAG: type II secretion system protein [Holophaga sp.]|nr:type II secretion system protein [Holophaga sp.]